MVVSPFNDFCGFWSVAVNAIDKLAVFSINFVKWCTIVWQKSHSKRLEMDEWLRSHWRSQGGAPPPKLGSQEYSWLRRWANYTKLCMVWQPISLITAMSFREAVPPRTTHLGLCPWTPLGDFRSQDLLYPHLQILATPLFEALQCARYCTIKFSKLPLYDGSHVTSKLYSVVCSNSIYFAPLPRYSCHFCSLVPACDSSCVFV